MRSTARACARRSRRRSPRSPDGPRPSRRRRRGPRAAARCLRAWPAACTRRRRVPAREHRAAGRHRVRARAQRGGHHQPVAGEAHVELVVDGRRRRPAGRRRGGSTTKSLAAQSSGAPSGPMASAGSDRAVQAPAQTRSSASAISSAATAVSAPRLPQATPRTGAPCAAAARSDASTVPSPPTATTRSPVLHRARRGELARAVAVDRELDHVDAVLGGPARERRERPVDAARRMDDQRNAPGHRLRDHAGDLSPRRRTPGPRAHRLHARARAPRLEGDHERERGDDAAEDLERRAQPERRDEQAGRDRRERERGVGDDVEGRHDRGAVLVGDRGRQGAQRARGRRRRSRRRR